MKMKINSIGNDAIQVQIDGEDYSIADIVHKELLSVKHVKFAGVAPPHPLIKALTIQLHSDGNEANELLKMAVSNAQERTNDILEVAKKVFPDAVKLSKVHASMTVESAVSSSVQQKPEEDLTPPSGTQETQNASE